MIDYSVPNQLVPDWVVSLVKFFLIDFQKPA